MSSSGRLWLLPAYLNEQAKPDMFLPSACIQIIQSIRYFAVETPKIARHYLRAIGYVSDFSLTYLMPLNGDVSHTQMVDFLKPVKEGHDAALLSDAGCPAVADPGAHLVQLAHQLEIEVCPLVGPSSLLLALMGSGLCGQRFCFHGYLPTDKNMRAQKIRLLEQESRQQSQTQIMIETPYRNHVLFESLLLNMNSESLLCVAYDLHGPDQCIKTHTIQYWRTHPVVFKKVPCVFLLNASFVTCKE